MAGKNSLSCSCEGEEQTEVPMARDAGLLEALNEFWPKGLTTPPSMPWLGGVVSRPGLYYWLSGFPDLTGQLAAGGFAAWAEFFTWSFGDSARAAAERKKRCRKSGPSGPTIEDCQSPVFASMSEADNWGDANCGGNYSSFAVRAGDQLLGYCCRCSGVGSPSGVDDLLEIEGATG